MFFACPCLTWIIIWLSFLRPNGGLLKSSVTQMWWSPLHVPLMTTDQRQWRHFTLPMMRAVIVIFSVIFVQMTDFPCDILLSPIIVLWIMKSLFYFFESAYVYICEYYCSGNFCMIEVDSILFVLYYFTFCWTTVVVLRCHLQFCRFIDVEICCTGCINWMWHILTRPSTFLYIYIFIFFIFVY